MRTRTFCGGLGALLFAAIAASPGAASALDKKECAAAAVSGQQLLGEDRYLAAREAFHACAQPECPALLIKDCTGWLGEAERNIASIALKVRDGQGRAVPDVKITIDRKPGPPSSQVALIDLDPGPHVITCEKPGLPVLVKQVVLDPGERKREILCDLPSEAAPGLQTGAARAAAAGPGAPPAEPPAAPESRGILPLSSWILGGVGIAGLATFAIAGLMGQSEQSTAEGPVGCAPHCPNYTVDSIRTKFIVADVGLVLGATSLAAATVIALLRPSAHATTTAAIEAPSPE